MFKDYGLRFRVSLQKLPASIMENEKAKVMAHYMGSRVI